ncbi:substance-K receptor-like [Paramacrobiotus metropolitanus]|uniref:substance-K receptor-like n=1 Tax=Paramacrobiotus metropolitanus TaxID=2943436 RepID=UPI002445D427|nr:substance-K receptor-like [Paramacrobiotus metropolitanus]
MEMSAVVLPFTEELKGLHYMNFSTNSGISNSATSATEIVWGFEYCLTAVCSILSLLLNSVVATFLLVRRELRKPFNCYLISILIADGLISLLGCINIAKDFIDENRMGKAVFVFMQYIYWVVAGIPLNLHVLVAGNRVWAVAYPFSFKLHHSYSFAVCLICAAIFYVHLICLPVVIMFDVFFDDMFATDVAQVPEILVMWKKGVMLLIYDAPIVMMAASWIFVAFRLKRQRNAISEKPRNSYAESQHAANSFWVFSALTLSVIVCWTPYEVYYTLYAFDRDYGSDAVVNLTLALYLVQPVIDPILLLITMGELRKAVSDTLPVRLLRTTVKQR